MKSVKLQCSCGQSMEVDSSGPTVFNCPACSALIALPPTLGRSKVVLAMLIVGALFMLFVIWLSAEFPF